MPDGSYFLIMALGGCMGADRGRVPNKGWMTLGNIRRSQPGMGHHSSCSPDDSRSGRSHRRAPGRVRNSRDQRNTSCLDNRSRWGRGNNSKPAVHTPTLLSEVQL